MSGAGGCERFGEWCGSARFGEVRGTARGAVSGTVKCAGSGTERMREGKWFRQSGKIVRIF